MKQWVFEKIVFFGSIFTAFYGILLNGRKYVDEATRLQ